MVEIAGGQVFEQLDGESLLPLFQDVNAPWRKHIITTLGRGSYAISSGVWKLIHYYDGSEELYDLKQDPSELCNLIADEDYATIKADLQKSIPEDQRYKHFIRYENWKATVESTGTIQLFDIQSINGISEQENVAAAYPVVVDEIRKYLTKHPKTGRFVVIE